MSRRWRIIEVPDDGTNKDLDDGELLGISVMLTQYCRKRGDEYNVYWRARQKIQGAVEQTFIEEQT